MNWIRFRIRLFGARIQINEPDRDQFEINEPKGDNLAADLPCSHAAVVNRIKRHNH